jgi:hypothetical protein
MAPPLPLSLVSTPGMVDMVEDPLEEAQDMVPVPLLTFGSEFD